ncbi:S41 family peptidase [Microlunatus sp. GCM10028923]|uniref:S41 family peptidase n=1 Tax=Microlunatus sp. GCM10028923 TaxID=3273400 RepID=UPI00366C66BE
MIAWIRDHVRREVVWPGWREWRIGEQVVNRWNVAVFSEPEGRGAPLESIIDAFALSTSSSLRTVDEPYMIARSASPWSGRMLVLTDKGSAPAAESAAWMLRTGLDAKIIGGRSAGAVGFGNLAPYLLPRSGLKLDLPTASSGWHEESMTGMPIDLAYDVCATLHETAANFDALHADAHAASREVSVELSAAFGAIEVPRC